MPCALKSPHVRLVFPERSPDCGSAHRHPGDIALRVCDTLLSRFSYRCGPAEKTSSFHRAVGSVRQISFFLCAQCCSLMMPAASADVPYLKNISVRCALCLLLFDMLSRGSNRQF